MSLNYTYTPYIWPMLMSMLFSAGLAFYAWRHRRVPGATPFAIQNLGIALWALLTAIEIMAVTVETKFVFHKLEAVSAFISMNAMLYFAIELSYPEKWANRRTVLFLSSVIIFLIALMVTNDFHHLLWTGVWFDEFLRVGRGPLNILIVGWGLLVPILAVALFLRLFFRSSGIYRQQALLLSVGAILPVLTYLLEPAGINPIAPADPVIVVWNISGLLYALAIFRFRMLSVVPIGRETAIERMTNGVLFLDADNRIVDLNPAAGEVLGLSRRSMVGHQVGQIFADYPDLLRLLDEKMLEGGEIIFYKDHRPRTYQVQISPLTHPGGFQMGQLILLQDVTDQIKARKQLIENQRAMAMLQERERLARELHDNLGQALAAAHLQTSTAKLLLDQRNIDRLSECLDSLADMTLQAEADMREYLLGVQSEVSADRPFFAVLSEYIQRFSRQYGLPVELTVPPEIEEREQAQTVDVQLLRIIQEALSNVRKHACATSARVKFTINNPLLQVVICDDGRGFDPAEIETKHVGGYGMQSMRERAESLGGIFQVESTPGSGTCVIVEIPVGVQEQGDEAGYA